MPLGQVLPRSAAPPLGHTKIELGLHILYFPFIHSFIHHHLLYQKESMQNLTANTLVHIDGVVHCVRCGGGKGVTGEHLT